jgi:hypothetical protein
MEGGKADEDMQQHDGQDREAAQHVDSIQPRDGGPSILWGQH